MTNNAEILYADDDDDPSTPAIPDADSDLSSQDGSSDDTTELGTDNDHDDEAPGTPGTGDNAADEDSYDPAQVVVGHVYDLALIKTTPADAGPYVL